MEEIERIKQVLATKDINVMVGYFYENKTGDIYTIRNPKNYIMGYILSGDGYTIDTYLEVVYSKGNNTTISRDDAVYLNEVCRILRRRCLE